MLLETIRAFIMIFVAEMGDKSQILAMTFATKYKLRYVYTGIFIGIFLNHTLAVLLGSYLDLIIPLESLSLIAGIIFVLFGLWSLSESEGEEEVKTFKYGPIITIAFAFFIGELGDKTQLTAITLSSDAEYPLLILLGTVTGMMVTSVLGIYIGKKMGSSIPVHIIKISSSVVFIIFGILKVYSVIGFNYLYISAPAIIISSIIYTILLIKLLNVVKSGRSSYAITAEKLKQYFGRIDTMLDSLCLGENFCGSCQGTKCLLGYTRNIVKNAKELKEIDLEYFKGKTIKDYDKIKVVESLNVTLESLYGNWDNPDYILVHEIRKSLELILYGECFDGDDEQKHKEFLSIK